MKIPRWVTACFSCICRKQKDAAKAPEIQQAAAVSSSARRAENKTENVDKPKAARPEKPSFSSRRLVCLAVLDSGGGAACASEYFWHYSELLIDPADGQLYVRGSSDRYRPVQENWYQDGYLVYMPVGWDRFQALLEDSESLSFDCRKMNSDNWREMIHAREEAGAGSRR